MLTRSPWSVDAVRSLGVNRVARWSAVGLIVLVLALSIPVRASASNHLAAATTTTLAPGTLIGGLDVNGYCEATTGGPDVLLKGGFTGPNFTSNNWACAANNRPLDMQKLCTYTYGLRYPGVVAKAANPNDAASWQCYAGPRLARAGRSTNVAPIAATIGTPRQIFHSLGHNLVNALIAVGAILLITFPANIFNETFSQHYGEIMLIVGRWRRRVRRLAGLHGREREALTASRSSGDVVDGALAPSRGSRLAFYSVLLTGSFLGSLLSPTFGINLRTYVGFAATICAFGVGIALSWFVAKTFRRWRHYPTKTFPRGLPLGLVVAGLCVLVSRLTNFEPGYLYGVVASIAFVETMKERHSAHLIVLSTCSTLAAATVAWIAWIPVNHAALQPGSNFLVVFLDDVLGSIFIAGLVGSVFALLPLHGLPGGTVAKWRKDVWTGVFFVALFLLIEVELHPAGGPTRPGSAPVATVAILFLVFGGLSLAMRSYFLHRAPSPATDDLAPNVPMNDP